MVTEYTVFEKRLFKLIIDMPFAFWILFLFALLLVVAHTNLRRVIDKTAEEMKAEKFEREATLFEVDLCDPIKKFDTLLETSEKPYRVYARKANDAQCNLGKLPEDSILDWFGLKRPVHFELNNDNDQLALYVTNEGLKLGVLARKQANFAFLAAIVILLFVSIVRFGINRYLALPIDRLDHLVGLMDSYVEGKPDVVDFEERLAVYSETTRKLETFVRRDTFPNLEKAILQAGIDLKKAREELEGKIEEKERLNTIRNIADKVAHDIKMPLLRLEKLKEEIQKRELDRATINDLIHESWGRMTGLIGELSRISREGQVFEPGEDKSIHMVWTLLARQVHFQKPLFGKKIQIELPPVHWDAWVTINGRGFRDVISNLLNNSAQAMEDGGKIRFDLATGNGVVQLSIHDTGKGIPADMLDMVLQQGFGLRQGGQGLGLWQAREFLEKNGGSLSITSTVGEGTSIHLTLPADQAPDWNINQLNIVEGGHAVVLDDRDLNHEAWGDRFAEISPLGDCFEEEYFYGPNEIAQWLDSDKPQHCLYIVDYMLMNNQNGLDVIKTHGLEKQAVLVTSLSEDEKVRERCLDMNVPLLAKELIPHIPLQLTAKPDTKSE